MKFNYNKNEEIARNVGSGGRVGPGFQGEEFL